MTEKLIDKLSISKPLWAVLVFNGLVIVAVFAVRNYLPPVVPLYYGFPKGAEQIAPSIALTIPPIIAIVVTLICVVIIALVQDSFLKKILFSTSVIVTTLSFVTVLKIILLVGSF